MCSYSMIADHYLDKYRSQFGQVVGGSIYFDPSLFVRKEDFLALKADFEDMKRLLAKAKAYDIKHDEPDCEVAEKVALLRRFAVLIGVDFDDVVPAK